MEGLELPNPAGSDRIPNNGPVILAAGLLVMVAACSAPASVVPAAQPSTPVATPAGSDIMVSVPGTLAADFDDLLPTLHGHAGLAVMPVGATRMVTLGDWTGGSAWSTIKVPLVLAVLRHDGDTATASMSAAITESDNSAADALWQSLGTPDTAAAAVQAVLRDGGDTTTTVPATRTRPDYSSFGQANWSLRDQLRFTARLPCLDDADTVTTLMGKISSTQRWGLGHLEGSAYKGGWGPDTNGKYLVRQLGLVSTGTGEIAIAVAAQPDSGSFDDGTAMLTKITAVIDKHLQELPGGSCSSNP